MSKETIQNQSKQTFVRAVIFAGLILVTTAAILAVVSVFYFSLTKQVEPEYVPAPIQDDKPIKAQSINFDCTNYKGYGVSFACAPGYYIDQYIGNNETIFDDFVSFAFNNKNHPVSLEGSPIYSFNLTTYKDPYNGSIDELMTARQSFERSESIKVGGVSGHKLICKTPWNPCYPEYVVFQNGRVYDFMTIWSQDFEPQAYNEFLEFLNTVQFYQE